MFQAYTKAGNHLAGRLRRDRSGSVLMLFGLFGSLAFVTAGGALDYGRWMQARYHTSRALDSAVLAGARALQLNQADPDAALAHAKFVYDSNVRGRLALKTDTIQFVTANSKMAVTASGQAAISTTLLGIIGISELPVAGNAGSKFPKATITAGGGGSSNMEVALMLDVTESMCTNGSGPCTTDPKIQGLKDAAKELVNIVVQADQSVHTSRVALVPFSTRVRVGPNGGGGAAMQAMTNLSPTWSGFVKTCLQDTWVPGATTEDPGTWTCIQYQTPPPHVNNLKIMPCVTDRMYSSGAPYDYTDRAPGSGHWMNAHGGDRMPLSEDGKDNSPGYGSGASAADPADNWNYSSNGSCDEYSNNNEIMPLSSDKSALTARIDGLEAYGATAGALGTAFSWYMLSPEWHNVWPSDSRPGNYSDLTNIQHNGKPKLRKVAVLMTDGGFNTFRGWKGQDQQTVSDHAVSLCAAMKAKGIEVFTIGFALNELLAGEQTIARKTLSDCGSDVSHFYETLTVDDLKTAFKEIAMSMTTVYLSE